MVSNITTNNQCGCSCKKGSTKAVVGSGIKTISDSLIDFQPAMKNHQTFFHLQQIFIHCTVKQATKRVVLFPKVSQKRKSKSNFSCSFIKTSISLGIHNQSLKVVVKNQYLRELNCIDATHYINSLCPAF